MFRRSLLIFALVGGCAPTSTTVVEQPAPVPMADTKLEVGDTFDVRVYGESELSGTYRVSAEGTITLPLAGTIPVAGLEPQEAASKIAERLADGILRNPQVTVLARDLASKKIYILGQVAKPGTIMYTASMSVVEAISLAGGFTQLAAKNDTTLTRSESGKKTIVKIPVESISEGRAKNVYLKPGDIISVPERLF
jgi:polysaccharide export outer membrane protein